MMRFKSHKCIGRLCPEDIGSFCQILRDTREKSLPYFSPRDGEEENSLEGNSRKMNGSWRNFPNFSPRNSSERINRRVV